MSVMGARPGGALATRPLHFVWLLDCSGSMLERQKIQSLNTAIREALPHMRKVADANPNANLLLRVVTFANDARWQVEEPTPVASFRWTDVEAGGRTRMGQALGLVAEALAVERVGAQSLPPVLALVSDGMPTDPDEYRAALETLSRSPWGAKSVRVAIAIGQDADIEMLQQFTGSRDRPPLRASNVDELALLIRWVSTVVVDASSQPAVQKDGEGEREEVALPRAPSNPEGKRPDLHGDVVW
jgi:uncharacterized protein YegL